MHLLRRRWFLLLTAGVAVDAIGSWAALIALWGFAAYRFDAGPTQIALLGLGWALPSMLIGPFAGVPIDRLGPRRVLIAAQGIGIAAAVCLAFATTWHELIAFGALAGVSRGFAFPASDALPPRLVDDDDLLAANAVLGAATDSAIVFGPMVAAAAIAVAGLRGAFVVDAATYVVGIAAVLPLRRADGAVARADVHHDSESATRRHPARQVLDELRRGLGVARRSAAVRWTLSLCLVVYLTWGTFVVIEPLYARDVLGASATTFALFQAVFGAALVLTGLLLPRLGDRVASPGFIGMSVMLSGVAAALYVGTHWVAAAYLGVALWGVDVAFFAAPVRTLLQKHTEPDLHGRVLALYRTAHGVGDVVGVPVAGLAAAAVGVQGSALVIAALAVVAGAFGLWRRPRVATPAPAVNGAAAPAVVH